MNTTLIFILTLLISLSSWSKAPAHISFHEQLKQFCKLKSECEDGALSGSSSAFQNLKLAEISTVLSCKNYYESNQCSDVKDLLGKASNSIVLSCDPKTLCDDFAELDKSQCLIDGAKSQFTPVNIAFLISTAIGGKVALAASVISFPLLVYGAGESAEQCHKDINFKTMSVKMHNLSLMEDERPLDVKGKDQAILNMQCSDLNSFLKTRLDVLAQKRADKQKWSLTPVTSKQSAESVAMRELLQSNRCFRPAVIQQNLCRGLAGLATGVLLKGTKVAATRVLSTPDVKYKTKRMSFAYIGESTRSNNPIRYFTPEEKARMKITVAPDGKLLNAKGKPLDVNKGMYVMDKDGNIFVHPENAGVVHHSSFLGGQPVAGAGHVTIQKGELKYIDRSSGHYKPKEIHFEQVLSELKAKGVDVKNAKSVNTFE